MNKIFASIFIAVSFFSTSPAQQSEILKQYSAKFPDAPAAFIERSETIAILVKNDSLEIFGDILEDMIHLKSQTDVYSTGRVFGSHFTEVKDLKAKTLIWEKNKFKEMHVTEFKKNHDQADGIFYDDSYNYSFTFPSVSLGNRTHLQYRTMMKDARFMPGYIFTSYIPQGKATYTIKTTRQVELVYEVVNDPKHTINFKKYEKGGYVFYEWTATDVPARKNEDESPSVRYFTPHLICYVKSYENKSGKVNVLSSLDDLYAWYNTFVKDLNKESSAELIGIVNKIKQSSKTEIDIVRNVFYWVQENIQYVAFEQGMRGFIPHHGSYVCEKRYGDCKDMANLIVTMLRLADVKSYHTWIGTRDLPYKYSQVPTPLVDNHMIATYISSDKQYYFLDATSDHTPFGLPSSMIQGKEALIGLDPTHYEIKAIPEIPKERNIMTDSVSIRLDGNQIVGSGISSLGGYPKVFGGYALDRSEKEDIKRYVTRLIGKGSNKFYLDNYALSDAYDRDKPTVIDYSFRIGDYFQKIGDELYVNMNLTKEHYNDFINLSLRETPKERDYKYEKIEYCELTIPEGYSVEYLPPNAKADGELLGFETEYTSENGKIVFRKKFYVNYLLMQPQQFEHWNASVKPLSEAYKESIILKKK
ncbi:transglutaminase domain-containing protein [Chryseolinea sp. H1M3-3]|uniref:transglutaminase-like domain-containing protein n=1 Tax=Chryseolinea sp. H1M3-3 TaxID=3034144 RepID=UPI0023EBB1E5|nr:transglutaminase domain-containing protein [Chryseolinea sp. H1M3-3]